MDREKAPFHLQVGPALGTAGGAEQGGGWEWGVYPAAPVAGKVTCLYCTL